MLCVPGFKFSSILGQHKRIITFKLLRLAFTKCIGFLRVDFTVGRKFKQHLLSLELLCKGFFGLFNKFQLAFIPVMNQSKRWSLPHWHCIQPSGYQLELVDLMDFTSCECGQFESSIFWGNVELSVGCYRRDRHSCSLISFIISLAKQTHLFLAPSAIK